MINCPHNTLDGSRMVCHWPDCCKNGSGRLDGECLDAKGSYDPGIGINLIGGRQIDLRYPRVEDILITDIAGALSKICRFAGHVPNFYSVAQHSVLVSRALPESLALAGLLHDASEAYLNDITRALKHSPEMVGYRQLEDRMQRTIFRAFNLPEDMDASIKRADQELAHIEMRTMLFGETLLMSEVPGSLPFYIEPLCPGVAEEMFLMEFVKLTRFVDTIS